MGRLFWKFFLAIQLAQLLAAGAVGAIFWFHAQSRNTQVNTDPRGEAAVLLAANTFKYGGLPALREALAIQAAPLPLLAVDDQGRDLLGRSVDAQELAAARAAVAAGEAQVSARQASGPGGESLLLFVPPRRFPPHLVPPGLLEPPRPPGAGPRFDRGRPPLPWLNILAGLLGSIGVSALLAWYVAKPIGHLRRAFQAVTAGRLDTRVGALLDRRRDEFAELGQDFDAMARQLEALIATQRRLFHDVSHELRSPLARLQAAIGLAHQDPGKLALTLERVERETRRLDELVDELLTLARLESGMPGPLDEELEVLGLLGEIVADASFEAAPLERRVEFRGEGQALLRGRVELLCRAFENVIRNAIKYAPAGSLVEVEAAARDGKLQVQVLDRGPGVREAELAAIFTPFFRGSDGESQGGYGLGLAIARRAIEAHGGSIQAANRSGGGLAVRIELPLQASRNGTPVQTGNK